MAIVGPLPKSSRGHSYILVLLDYATRYPEAILEKEEEEEILTEQDSCFMSGVMKILLKSEGEAN